MSKPIIEKKLNEPIAFTSSKWEVGDINRNDPLYSAIYKELSEISIWVKNGGKLELNYIDQSVERIIKAFRQQQEGTL